MKFSFLAAMDGNNSLKLVDSMFRSGKVRHDNRTTDSLRWITPEDVDVFKDEVHKKVCLILNISTSLTFQHQNVPFAAETAPLQPPTQKTKPSGKVCLDFNISTLLTI